MKFKSLKVLLIAISLICTSFTVVADKPLDVIPENPKYKADRLEKEVNELFQRGFRMASIEMDTKKQVKPFAVIHRKDGKYGVFSIDDNEKNKNISIESQAASIRKYLIELVVADQIDAAMQVMYATVKEEGKPARQGLMFEIEHEEGVSLLRFLPVSKIKDTQGVDTGRLLFEMESLSTSAKPEVVFAYSKKQAS